MGVDVALSEGLKLEKDSLYRLTAGGVRGTDRRGVVGGATLSETYEHK